MHSEPKNEMKNLPDEVSIHFRDDLRAARAATLRNGEDFQELLCAIERLGKYLSEEQRPGLGAYQKDLRRIVKNGRRDLDDDFLQLFNNVRDGRNDAFHDGAAARVLTANATNLAIILEDALMANVCFIGSFMVRNPVCAFGWQPLSLLRYMLLAHSFSFLPFYSKEESRWRLVSDSSLAKYLRAGDRSRLLPQTLGQALPDVLHPDRPFVCEENTLLSKVIEEFRGLPVLIRASDEKQLLGIATPFDLL